MKSRPDPPRILVLSAGPEELLREVCAGMEEEGVPFDVQTAEPASAADLAVSAARRSTLEVGIGLDARGLITVQHAKLPPDRPVSQTTGPDPRAARTAGHDAARVVVGAPLMSAHPHEETR